MRRLLPLLLLLTAGGSTLFTAGCAARGAPPGVPATVTLLADRGRLETWDAWALAGGHLHARSNEGACSATAELLRATTTLLATQPEEKREPVKQAGEAMAAVFEGMCATLFGRGYGGRGRIALALRPGSAGGAWPEEALFVVVPALAPGETERTFRAPEILAEFLSPLDRVEAALDGGRVLVRRLPDGRHEFELFLVLRPAAPASYERLQVVARVETR